MKIFDKEVSDELPVFQQDIEIKKLLMEGLQKDELSFQLTGALTPQEDNKSAFVVHTIEVVKK